MREAKSQLTQLAERVLNGDKVVITKAGKPYVDLLPHVDSVRLRKPGRLKGKIRMPADFDKTSEDIVEGFERICEETGGGVRNFVFGHNMSKRCMYANQKETRVARATENPERAARAIHR
ncbi:type II toxin-antitoxin system prevent-host-death family antitoxin, partial [Pseudomonas fluorescens]|uniref:type II toxin-antitoxin system Phd/YefM family antitoxin n=1 Tax=Pseudomonas fluorescens TaxID=294 RepID=UPI001CD1AD52